MSYAEFFLMTYPDFNLLFSNSCRCSWYISIDRSDFNALFTFKSRFSFVKIGWIIYGRPKILIHEFLALKTKAKHTPIDVREIRRIQRENVHWIQVLKNNQSLKNKFNLFQSNSIFFIQLHNVHKSPKMFHFAKKWRLFR